MEKNTNRKSKLPAIAFGLVALISTVPSPAFADEQATERVPYGDLNLASDDGIKALDRRLDRAVKRICGEPDPRVLHQSAQVRACQEKAQASIVPQRSYAIARATGQDNKRWAENGAGQTVVTLSE